MRLFVPLILASLGAANALAQTPASGMFLVATAEQRDPRFAQSVILLLGYGREGATGIIINRPTWVEPEALFPDDAFFRRYRGAVYFGGPVARTSTLFLVRDGTSATGESVIDDIHITVDVDELRENLPATADERTVRVYAGYSGWGPDQLDREIAAGAWQVAPASADQVFTREPVQLWREVHRVASEISLVGLPVIRYRGRCASRVARNSLFSFQAGQSSPSASRAPIR